MAKDANGITMRYGQTALMARPWGGAPVLGTLSRVGRKDSDFISALGVPHEDVPNFHFTVVDEDPKHVDPSKRKAK